MNWTQEKYKVETMIDNATLTGAVITALGSFYGWSLWQQQKIGEKFGQGWGEGQ